MAADGSKAKVLTTLNPAGMDIENWQILGIDAGYRAEFLKLFGFGLPGIDYNADVEPHITMP